jgi:curli biogenesis system outer membrane secretion channel CsgG
VVLIGLLLVLAGLTGCIARNGASKVESPVAIKENSEPAIPVPANRKLIAILGFENKSTYASDKLWDTSSQLLFSNILEMGYFRVVEWEKMKQLFDWDAMTTSKLIKNPGKISEISRILLCEYFVSGAVTYFNVRQTSEVSAMSKQKAFETTIRVDLVMQNAATGEYISAGSGEATEKREFAGGLTGGQQGTWDPQSADAALNRAISQALYKLTKNYDRIGSKP